MIHFFCPQQRVYILYSVWALQFLSWSESQFGEGQNSTLNTRAWIACPWPQQVPKKRPQRDHYYRNTAEPFILVKYSTTWVESLVCCSFASLASGGLSLSLERLWQEVLCHISSLDEWSTSAYRHWWYYCVQVLQARWPKLPEGWETASESRKAPFEGWSERDSETVKDGEAWHTMELLPERWKFFSCTSSASSHSAKQPWVGCCRCVPNHRIVEKVTFLASHVTNCPDDHELLLTININNYLFIWRR